MATVEVPVQQAALETCKRCGRSFESDALSRHQPACMRGGLKNRNKFDSHRQRLEGDAILSTV